MKEKKSYWIPADQELRKKWIIAIGRPTDNLPRFPHLCSEHFHPSCFNESVELQNKLVRGTKRKLKADAVLSIFQHRPASKVCTATVATAAKRKHQEVRKLKVRLKVFLLTMILIMNTHLSSPKQAQHQVSMKLRKALILLALIQFFLFMKTISKSNQNVVLQWRKLRRQKMKGPNTLSK